MAQQSQHRTASAGGHYSLTLEDAIRERLQTLAGSHSVELICPFSASAPLDPELFQTAYLLVDEAITNVTRHARATRIRVGILQTEASLCVMIEDDGVGFDQAAQRIESTHGIRMMKERALSQAAALEISSTPTWGTSVKATFPLEPFTTRFQQRVEVLVAESRPALRAGLGSIISRADMSISILGEVGTPAAAIDFVRWSAPTIALVGLGFEEAAPPLIAELVRIRPDMPVIVVSTPWTTHDLLERAFASGAYLCVDAANDGRTIANAVEAAIRGQAVRASHRTARPDLHVTSSENALTAREREVRALMELGQSDRQIAVALDIAIKTVEKHVSSVLHKTGARSRLELVLQNKLDGQVVVHEGGGRVRALRPPTI
ncbi:LuxR C-terminal-related transcriptional regulator [Lysinimonas soli]|uniref:histidine kinase n=1 Tax=Lysinimonas soli TaxID=1074233 RepID=A0ABW0NPZ4_9MICO